jgi:Flp pilus assembly pilin Flp
MTHQRDRPSWRRLALTWLQRDNGVESLEVALIGALIVIAIMLAVPPLATGIGDALESVATAITNAGAELE